jgi:sulfane dehydrogenase subunit SoxC
MKTLNKDIKKESSKEDTSATRREFFKKTASYGASFVAASTVIYPSNLLASKDDPAIMNKAPWGTKLGDPIDAHLYGVPSPYEHNNTRRINSLLSSGDKYGTISLCPIHESQGITTPNGLFFTRNHGGTAQVDPNKFRLMIHGKMKKPIVLTLDQIKRYPSETRTYMIECPANNSTGWRGPQFNNLQFMKGMMSCATWTGVMLKSILKDLGIDKDAVWMLAEGSDNATNPRTIPTAKAMDDAMLVWGQNGEALRAEQGYPLRLLLPGWEGNLSTKWLRRLEFSDKPWHSKEETSKYTMLQKSGKSIRYFWANEVNSVITSPCPEKPWLDVKPGDTIEVEGIAWSGKGTIKYVDISLDGGDNFVQAQLKGLVLPKAWTRFSYIMKWEGNPLLMTSRATDDLGDTQPTVDQETQKKGVESIYHRNAMTTWEITEWGEVNNVHIRKHNA